MTAGRRPAVFLDRDGVLNEVRLVDGTPHPPERAEDLTLLPGVVEACTTLADAGLPLVVVTNQPDIARGATRWAEVEEINARLAAQLPLTAILVCPHDDADDCACRKPRPGLLERAAEELGIVLEASVMVGDRWRDVEAGARAGCRTVFVDHTYNEHLRGIPDLVVSSLIEATPWILDRTAERSRP